MGKKHNDVFETKKSLLEEQKKLQKKIAKIRIPCSHTTAKGKLKVDFINGAYCECKNCGTKFDFEQIELKDLEDAILTVHNAINQIKAFTNNPDDDRRIIITLGDLDYNLSEIKELYKRTTKEFGKGKKNKKSYDDSFGSYGASSINFVGSGKKNKYYK